LWIIEKKGDVAWEEFELLYGKNFKNLLRKISLRLEYCDFSFEELLPESIYLV
jgi:hypothetical protein